MNHEIGRFFEPRNRNTIENFNQMLIDNLAFYT